MCDCLCVYGQSQRIPASDQAPVCDDDYYYYVYKHKNSQILLPDSAAHRICPPFALPSLPFPPSLPPQRCRASLLLLLSAPSWTACASSSSFSLVYKRPVRCLCFLCQQAAMSDPKMIQSISTATSRACPFSDVHPSCVWAAGLVLTRSKAMTVVNSKGLQPSIARLMSIAVSLSLFVGGWGLLGPLPPSCL